MDDKQSLISRKLENKLSLIPLGGVGDVTKNMYVYQYKDQILLVDCGLGFPDETMIGVDLIIPDVSYLVKNKKNIIGMFLTHAHEDHIGALPYILPQLSSFPIFATPLTAAFANEKLKEFDIATKVKAISFDDKVSLGAFSISLVHVTHSVPDSSNFVITSPVGTFYHASDFKLDPTPVDGFPTEVEKIKEAGRNGVTCLLSDCLRIERDGRTPSEKNIEDNFEKELQVCRGKFIVTTYSSNVSRLNQAIRVARKFGRKVCFIGRSLEKSKELAINMGFIEKLGNVEIEVSQIRFYKDQDLVLLIAGSQGQANSAMVRIANDEDKFVRIKEGDMVVFSADPIPGNEVAINSLIDTLYKKGARVIYSALTDELHVSGHAARDDIADMITWTHPRFLIPIGGAYRHMVQFRLLAESLGYKKNDIFLIEDGQEVIFEKDKAYTGGKINVRNVYVDEITGEEIEGVVIRDRQKLAKDGTVAALINIDTSSGQILGNVYFMARAFNEGRTKQLFSILDIDIKKTIGKHKNRAKNLTFIRNLLSEHIERLIFKKTGRRPLVLPIVVEV